MRILFALILLGVLNLSSECVDAQTSASSSGASSRALSASTTLVSSLSANAQAITLIGEDDWYPYSAKKDGKLQGFTVDVVQAAYAAVNVTVSFKTMSYARCMLLVESGKELGCFNSLKVGHLIKEFVFHEEPFFSAEVGIYALQSSVETGLKVVDLHNRTVGVTNGYTYSDEIDKGITIKREIAWTDLSNLRKLVLKRSDYSLVYTRVFDHLSNKYSAEFKGKVKQVGSVTIDNLYVSFSKKREESSKFAALLDLGLRKIKSNGEYAKLEQKWRTPEP